MKPETPLLTALRLTAHELRNAEDQGAYLRGLGFSNGTAQAIETSRGVALASALGAKNNPRTPGR